MVMLIVYFPLHLWKGDFKYPIIERIVFFLGEAFFLTLFFIFKYKPVYITDYDLDFFGLTIVILIDFFVYLIRGIRLMCYGESEGQVGVNPETNRNSPSPRVKPNK